MDIVLLDKKIIAIGHTEGMGSVLLINKDNEAVANQKCVVYEVEVKSAYLIDNINKATTFNAFSQFESSRLADIFIDRINRTLSNERIAEINAYLSAELVD